MEKWNAETCKYWKYFLTQQPVALLSWQAGFLWRAGLLWKAEAMFGNICWAYWSCFVQLWAASVATLEKHRCLVLLWWTAWTVYFVRTSHDNSYIVLLFWVCTRRFDDSTHRSWLCHRRHVGICCTLARNCSTHCGLWVVKRWYKYSRTLQWTGYTTLNF